MAIHPDLIVDARNFPAATLHEAAGRIGALPSEIKPVSRAFRLCGPAFTIRCPVMDNLWLHRAIYRAHPGDVLVASVGKGDDAGYWGEILNEAAMAVGLAGLVIDGGVRDSAMLREQPFPVFSRTLCIQGTGKDKDGAGWLQRPVVIGKVIVRPGDLVAGDADGVVAIPQELVEVTLRASRTREADERGKIEHIRAGARTIDLYGLGESPNAVEKSR